MNGENGASRGTIGAILSSQNYTAQGQAVNYNGKIGILFQIGTMAGVLYLEGPKKNPNPVIDIYNASDIDPIHADGMQAVKLALSVDARLSHHHYGTHEGEEGRAFLEAHRDAFLASLKQKMSTVRELAPLPE